jgi:chemotaxis signal transduction protein
MNHRGAPVTLVDLGVLLGRDAAFGNPQHRVVVLRWRNHDLALAVDDVVTLVPTRAAEAPGLLDLDALLGPIF